MATYAVGDLQGCLDDFKALLEQLRFDPAKDTVWLAGDLINRGPQSLATLRYVRDLGDACISVLGNHDLHFLAVAFGAQKKLGKRDTIREILDSADCQELADWLRQQPLLHHQYDLTMIHAGLPPQWSIKQARKYAKEAQQAIAGPNPADFFAHMYSNEPNLWDKNLTGWDRIRFIVNCLTRLRYCTADGQLIMKDKGKPEESANKGYLPWFKVPGRRSADDLILFGHWSTLGTERHGNVISLDGGCVWGGHLAAIQVDTLTLKSTPTWFHHSCALHRPPT